MALLLIQIIEPISTIGALDPLLSFVCSVSQLAYVKETLIKDMTRIVH